ncbi:MAG TPA: ATP-binding protein, partial [Thermoanaerobaculia bacterium]|nr:ATP-binding protein [Thermoanaerobaculia bacterium]
DYLERWKEQTGISTELMIDGDLRVRPAVELQLVRIVQEALTNVRKHARASRVTVALHKTAGRIVATVTDDGIGFDPSAKIRGDFPRLGLATMRERAESVGGSVAVESTRGAGTTVRFELPLEDQAVTS